MVDAQKRDRRIASFFREKHRDSIPVLNVSATVEAASTFCK
jgi:hypothetical protein